MAGGCRGLRCQSAQIAIKRIRPAHFPESGDYHSTTVDDRYALPPGQTFDGQAIVEERESTLVAAPEAASRSPPAATSSSPSA